MKIKFLQTIALSMLLETSVQAADGRLTPSPLLSHIYATESSTQAHYPEDSMVSQHSVSRKTLDNNTEFYVKSPHLLFYSLGLNAPPLSPEELEAIKVILEQKTYAAESDFPAQADDYIILISKLAAKFLPSSYGLKDVLAFVNSKKPANQNQRYLVKNIRDALCLKFGRPIVSKKREDSISGLINTQVSRKSSVSNNPRESSNSQVSNNPQESSKSKLINTYQQENIPDFGDNIRTFLISPNLLITWAEKFRSFEFGDIAPVGAVIATLNEKTYVDKEKDFPPETDDYISLLAILAKKFLSADDSDSKIVSTIVSTLPGTKFKFKNKGLLGGSAKTERAAVKNIRDKLFIKFKDQLLLNLMARRAGFEYESTYMNSLITWANYWPKFSRDNALIFVKSAEIRDIISIFTYRTYANTQDFSETPRDYMLLLKPFAERFLQESDPQLKAFSNILSHTRIDLSAPGAENERAIVKRIRDLVFNQLKVLSGNAEAQMRNSQIWNR